MVRILDGGGSGSVAKVTDEGMIRSYSVIESDFNHHSEAGWAFIVSSGTVTLTSTSQSAILYMKNDSDYELNILTFNIGWNQSIGGTNGAKMVSYLNPTGGTILDNALPGVGANLNYSSSREFVGSVYKGVEGDTTIGGSPFGSLYFDTTKADFRSIQIPGNIMPKGYSFTFTIIPPAGNTSLEMSFSVRCFYKTRNLGTI